MFQFLLGKAGSYLERLFFGLRLAGFWSRGRRFRLALARRGGQSRARFGLAAGPRYVRNFLTLWRSLRQCLAAQGDRLRVRQTVLLVQDHSSSAGRVVFGQCGRRFGLFLRHESLGGGRFGIGMLIKLRSARQTLGARMLSEQGGCS